MIRLTELPFAILKVRQIKRGYNCRALNAMEDYVFTKHALDMLEERGISKSWVLRALNEAENTFIGDDGNRHFVKPIAERENRVLHVIVNASTSPKRIVTLFFDRRLRSKP